MLQCYRQFLLMYKCKTRIRKRPGRIESFKLYVSHNISLWLFEFQIIPRKVHFSRSTSGENYSRNYSKKHFLFSFGITVKSKRTAGSNKTPSENQILDHCIKQMGYLYFKITKPHWTLLYIGYLLHVNKPLILLSLVYRQVASKL